MIQLSNTAYLFVFISLFEDEIDFVNEIVFRREFLGLVAQVRLCGRNLVRDSLYVTTCVIISSLGQISRHSCRGNLVQEHLLSLLVLNRLLSSLHSLSHSHIWLVALESLFQISFNKEIFICVLKRAFRGTSLETKLRRRKKLWDFHRFIIVSSTIQSLYQLIRHLFDDSLLQRGGRL